MPVYNSFQWSLIYLRIDEFQLENSLGLTLSIYLYKYYVENYLEYLKFETQSFELLHLEIQKQIEEIILILSFFRV